jgi:hypothetical protein
MVANNIPVPDYVLYDVRSISGVTCAALPYAGSALMKLHNGAYCATNIEGTDDTSLIVRPTHQ